MRTAGPRGKGGRGRLAPWQCQAPCYRGTIPGGNTQGGILSCRTDRQVVQGPGPQIGIRLMAHVACTSRNKHQLSHPPKHTIPRGQKRMGPAAGAAFINAAPSAGIWRARRATATMCPPICALRARWSLDARFGCKKDAVKLMQEWIQQIGSKAGLASSNVRLSTGAVGAPESRIELEVEMADMAELEKFWANIPGQPHAEWSMRIKEHIVDGTPSWHVFRSIPIDTTDGLRQGGLLAIVDDADEAKAVLGLPQNGLSFGKADLKYGEFTTTESGLSMVESMEDADAVLRTDDNPVEKPVETKRLMGQDLDWKGEPLKWNPGDKLPRIQ